MGIIFYGHKNNWHCECALCEIPMRPMSILIFRDLSNGIYNAT